MPNITSGPSLAEISMVLPQLKEKLMAEARERNEFLSGLTFARMIALLRDTQTPICIDGDDLAYFAEQTKPQLGWEWVTDVEIDLFMSAISDESAKTVEPGSLSSDTSKEFGNFSFRHFGLNIDVVFGQGTCITITNDAAVRKARAEQALPSPGIAPKIPPP